MLDFARTPDTPTSRRANARAAHASGVPAGPPGPPAADCEPTPNHDNTPATTLVGGCTTGAVTTGWDASEKLDTDGTTSADDTTPVEPPDVIAADRRPGAESDVGLNDLLPVSLPTLLLLLLRLPLVSGLAAPDEAPPLSEIALRWRLPDGPVNDFGSRLVDDDPKPAPLGEPDDEPPALLDTDVVAPPEADTPEDEPPDAVEPLDGEDSPDADVPDDPVGVVVDEPGDAEPPGADDVDDVLDVPAEEAEPDDDEPLEPADPVPSAKATPGADAMAAPTPNATANAATRPIYRA
jgi:hypothetical protein